MTVPNPSPAASTLGQGLTMGQLLRLGQLCCGGGQAGGQWHQCTGAVRVPGLPAVVAELSATTLTPTGEAGTFGTTMGKDSVAVERRQLELGYSRVPPLRHSQARLWQSQSHTELEPQPRLRRAGIHPQQPTLSHTHSPGAHNYLAQPRAPALADRAAQALQPDQDWILPWAYPAQYRTK